jgi:secretion/DNA translocation related TadE-like protein
MTCHPRLTGPPATGRGPTGRRCADRGSASVWLLSAGLVLLTGGLAGAALGAAHTAQHRAQAAADLGALAGAARAVEGWPAACARATELVTANGGHLTGCELDGLDLTVTVEVVPAPPAGLGRVATATARAGPVRADDSR